ncbi:hypothetical protein PY310_21510, partial [Pseudarthrobacter sp. H3Y2-7]|nr:hypothetical protein [Pseudarthrobacter sp. H3Y2-7]
ATARLTLKDGRIVSLPTTIQPPRLRVSLLSKTIDRRPDKAVFPLRLTDANLLPDDARITLSVKATGGTRFTSQESLDDARACAEALGCRYTVMPIAPAVTGMAHADEAGGLSGAPVHELSLAVIRRLRERLGDSLAIIGVGGVLAGRQALEKMQAGADAVQLYTGLIYRGPALVGECVRAVAR